MTVVVPALLIIAVIIFMIVKDTYHEKMHILMHFIGGQFEGVCLKGESGNGEIYIYTIDNNKNVLKIYMGSSNFDFDKFKNSEQKKKKYTKLIHEYNEIKGYGSYGNFEVIEQTYEEFFKEKIAKEKASIKEEL